MANRMTELDLNSPCGSFVARMIEPSDGMLAPDPVLLLTFAADRASSLTVEPYSIAAAHILGHGHRAASFDLPNHGDRIDDHGSGIDGFRDALLAGRDPFAMFVGDASALIDRCVTEGLARPGRIVVSGTSRGGYMALRLLAADQRVAAAAAYAPVTDWRQLAEFADHRDRSVVAALDLCEYTEEMAGKAVYVAIGSDDHRVSTDHCRSLAEALAGASSGPNAIRSKMECHFTDDEGHSLGAEWHRRGAVFLLDAMSRLRGAELG
jgi:dienelactone hydrolase